MIPIVSFLPSEAEPESSDEQAESANISAKDINMAISFFIFDYLFNLKFYVYKVRCVGILIRHRHRKIFTVTADTSFP